MDPQRIGQPEGGKKKSRLTTIFLILIILGLVWAVLNQRAILDYVALRNYTAPDVIANIADEDTFTPKARKIFYVNHPDISDKTSFVSKCTSGSSKEKTIVLGCYHGNQAGVFVLQVNDSRLNGVEQVTAAHEMLHAAYDRLSSSEKNKIDDQLLAFYHTGLKDQRIITTIDAYKKSEPKDVVNEMHSIFATEVSKLPPGLEDYYKQFFVNRSKVTNFANQYQAEFSSRQDQIKLFDAELADLKAQIDRFNAELKVDQQNISEQQTKLNNERSNGNVSAYNQGVAPYNLLVDNFNNLVTKVQGLVDEYNSVVAERNAIAIEQQELANALSASPAQIK